jgi:TonB family protein
MSIVPHPEYNKNNLSHDMALLKLDRPVSTVTSTGIYTLEDEKSQHVWFVGRGDLGNGQKGITGSSENLHHAENIIENAEGLWITFDFDAPENKALPLEGISGPGDSGGPAFINTATGLKVAGVSSHQRNNASGEGFYGVDEYYTRTSAHQQWVADIMALQDDELAKVALNRPTFTTLKATTSEVNALIGRYKLADGSEFFIETCADEVCYRWGESSSQTVIFKTTEQRWFTPKLNRVFSIQWRGNGRVKKIVMDDFHGQRQLIRTEKNQVSALKDRIQTRGRELITHVEPIWPKKAIDKKIEGRVIMSFSINTDGSVDNIKVTESTPKGMFEQASITALLQWKYAKLDKPLSGIMTQFDFTL